MGRSTTVNVMVIEEPTMKTPTIVVLDPPSPAIVKLGESIRVKGQLLDNTTDNGIAWMEVHLYAREPGTVNENFKNNLTAAYGKMRGEPGYHAVYDYNNDGIIDLDDFQLMVQFGSWAHLGIALTNSNPLIGEAVGVFWWDWTPLKVATWEFMVLFFGDMTYEGC